MRCTRDKKHRPIGMFFQMLKEETINNLYCDYCAEDLRAYVGEILRFARLSDQSQKWGSE